MTIYSYRNKGTGTFIGFHIDTFCSTSQNEDSAKRYMANTPEKIESQKQVILKNLKHILNPENDKALFGGINKKVRETCFPGLTFDDIEMLHKEVEDVKISNRVHTIISETGVTKVDMPLEECVVNLVKDLKNGAGPRE